MFSFYDEVMSRRDSIYTDDVYSWVKKQESQKGQKKEYDANRYQENKEEIKEKSAKYYQEHKEQKREYNSNYYEMKKNKLKQDNNLYYNDNKEIINKSKSVKVLCVCGRKVRKGDIAAHYRTNIHKKKVGDETGYEYITEEKEKEKEKINTSKMAKVRCICGSELLRGNITTHYKSITHREIFGDKIGYEYIIESNKTD